MLSLCVYVYVLRDKMKLLLLYLVVRYVTFKGRQSVEWDRYYDGLFSHKIQHKVTACIPIRYILSYKH